MRYLAVGAVIALGFLGSAGLQAQRRPPTAPPRYASAHDNPKGRELVAVLLSSSTCVGNTVPGFLSSVDAMNRLLASQAKARGEGFVAIGVATDWMPDSGYAYLKRLSAFDEVIVGRNWFNLGVSRYVWADTAGQAVEPQVLLVEREIVAVGPRPRITPDRIIARIQGPDSLIAWVNRGAPLPAPAP